MAGVPGFLFRQQTCTVRRGAGSGARPADARAALHAPFRAASAKRNTTRCTGSHAPLRPGARAAGWPILRRCGSATAATPGSLRALGMRLSPDDFGAGWSHLGQLKDYPVDKPRIARALMGRR
jgi:hypothetical protein